MREIRDQIIIIHKESTKKFNQLYRMLHSNPHLGHQFHLRSWSHYYLTHVPIALWFEIIASSECWSSLPVISCIFPIILLLLIVIPSFPIMFLSMIYLISLYIISFILRPWYYISGNIFPRNIELSIAYYRDMFGSNLDLNPPVIID